MELSDGQEYLVNVKGEWIEAVYYEASTEPFFEDRCYLVMGTYFIPPEDCKHIIPLSLATRAAAIQQQVS